MKKAPKPRRSKILTVRPAQAGTHALVVLPAVPLPGGYGVARPASRTGRMIAPRLNKAPRRAHMFSHAQFQKVLDTIKNPPQIEVDDYMRQVIKEVQRIKIVR